MRPIAAVLALALSLVAVFAQANPPADASHRDWKAAWITHPTAPLREPLVLHFRRTLDLPSVPASYIVRVSADNRFILYANGHRVGDGPARGDLAHWRYERFDLAPYLQPGLNFITATVWNFGVYAPLAQMSDRTAFLLESEAGGPSGISTPSGWLVEEEPGQRPLDRSTVTIKTYFASGPGEEIDASKYDWDWNSASSRPALGSRGLTHARQHIRWHSTRSLRRHHRRQPLGFDTRLTAAHGVCRDERWQTRSKHYARWLICAFYPYS